MRLIDQVHPFKKGFIPKKYFLMSSNNVDIKTETYGWDDKGVFHGRTILLSICRGQLKQKAIFTWKFLYEKDILKSFKLEFGEKQKTSVIEEIKKFIQVCLKNSDEYMLFHELKSREARFKNFCKQGT